MYLSCNYKYTNKTELLKDCLLVIDLKFDWPPS